MRPLGLVLALTLFATAPIDAQQATVVMIVHPERDCEMSLDGLAQIYLRRKRFWDDGTQIVPLNLVAGSALRARFSHAVLRQNEPRLEDYWNRQYFAGVLPPVTLASTEAVRRYVASDRNAIGYVPVAEVDDSVRVVLQLE
jgi:hypothetical protein